MIFLSLFIIEILVNEDIFDKASIKILWLIKNFESLLFLSSNSFKNILQMAKLDMNLLIVDRVGFPGIPGREFPGFLDFLSVGKSWNSNYFTGKSQIQHFVISTQKFTLKVIRQ